VRANREKEAMKISAWCVF